MIEALVLHGADWRVGSMMRRCYFRLGILLFHVRLISFSCSFGVCNILCMDVVFMFSYCGLGLGGADGPIDRFET